MLSQRETKSHRKVKTEVIPRRENLSTTNTHRRFLQTIPVEKKMAEKREKYREEVSKLLGKKAASNGMTVLD